MSRNLFVFATFVSTSLLACGGGKGASSEPAAGGGAPASGDLTAQIDHGKAEYTEHCSKCHGAGGEGTADAPAVVGAGALPLDPPASRQFRKSKFVTAADIAGFAVPNMPPTPEARTGLAEADYWAILAFDLTANGIKLTEPVSAANAASIVIPR